MKVIKEHHFDNFSLFLKSEHIGFLVDDVYAACDAICTMGHEFRKESGGGSMKGLEFAYDPDGCSIEVMKRVLVEFGDRKVVKN